MNERNIEKTLSELRLSSRASLIMVILGALCLLGSLYYSATRLSPLEAEIERKTFEINRLSKIETDYNLKIDAAQKTINSLKEDSKRLRSELVTIQREVNNTQKTQDSILDFLVSVTDKQKVHILDSSVNWGEVKTQLSALPAGDRKNALLNAILLAWKDIPFSMGREDVRAGFDSPRFLRYVLSTVGLDIKNKDGEPLSVTLMKRFKKIDTPMPGDLVFFKGQVGNFGFILASVGDNDSEHVGIGTLQRVAPLQIISMGNINTPFFPLRGYYRVVYPDEH